MQPEGLSYITVKKELFKCYYYFKQQTVQNKIYKLKKRKIAMIYFNIYGVALSKPINGIDYIPLNPSLDSIMCYYRRQTPSIIIQNPIPEEKPEPFGPKITSDSSQIEVIIPKNKKRIKGSLDSNLE